MRFESALVVAMAFGSALSGAAAEPTSKPVELAALKALIGVWDAEIEVWPKGLDSPSIKFKGVETNRSYGDYWVASDFDSEFEGQTTRVHSIVGYDLDQKQLVGTIIDHGPYAASLAGEYDEESKTLHWITEAKDPAGNPMSQKTQVTLVNADERVLVLMVPDQKNGGFTKCMQIRFVRRK